MLNWLNCCSRELVCGMLPGLMLDSEDPRHIYENVGEVRGNDDDGWGSSEFEEYEEEDQRSIGAHSQNSQESVEHGSSKTKNLFRRKVPTRLSRGKPGADVQAMVSCGYFVFDWTKLNLIPKLSHFLLYTKCNVAIIYRVQIVGVAGAYGGGGYGEG